MPMACSKSPMTFKGDCAAVSPLPSVLLLPLLHLIHLLLCQSHPRIFYVCSTLHSEQSQNDLGHAHLLLFGIGIALRGMQAEARCTLRVAAALIYCLLLPWLWFAIFSRISMATWTWSAPLCLNPTPNRRVLNPESLMPS